MAIIFTRHALQQMKFRKINKVEINTTLNNPDKTSRDKFGNFIAQKKHGNYLLRVVYLPEKDAKRIITAYKTSKLNKYK